MCGISTYIGNKQAFPIVVKGLKRLEYRGYDSAGVALFNGDKYLYKKKASWELFGGLALKFIRRFVC